MHIIVCSTYMCMYTAEEDVEGASETQERNLVYEALSLLVYGALRY